MLSFQNVHKVFSNELYKKPFVALNDVSFDIHEGKITGFLGANGAGKTTSLKIILGFVKPTKGHILFAPSLGDNFQKILSQIGFFPERPYLYQHLTGREYLSYMGELNGLNRIQIRDQSIRWTKRLNIIDSLDVKLRNYSKGMQQRLGFCSILLHDPRFVILDEPLSGLDPIGRQEFKEIFRELNKQGKTLFFSSHIVPDIEEICHDVVVLDKGELVFSGSIDEILNSNPDFSYRANIKVKNQLEYELHGANVISREASTLLVEFPVANRELIIKKLINDDVEIVSIQPKRKSLEEIVYKLKYDK